MTWAVLVASPYSSALHSSLARVQGYSLMVTTHNSTILKENGITEDVLFLVLVGSKKLCIRSLDTKSPCLYLQFLYPVTRHKEAYVYPHNFSVSFFFVLGNTPIPQPWWMPSNRQDLFFYWNFLSLWFFMVFVPFNKSIIIAMIIFIMLQFCLLLCHKPIGNVLQWPWAYLKGPGTHFLCFKMIRFMTNRPWAVARTHFLYYILIRNIFQHVCVFPNSLFTHFLGL